MRLRTGAVVAAAVVLGACGGGGVGGSASTTTTAGGTTIVTYGGIPGEAQSVACMADAHTVETAAQLYLTTHGSPAPSIVAR